uniref:VWFA domain-containing protein n=1 Tax=Panagrolaimus sp. JU765 TaxID=591449 RepID=A0AC34QNH6_9BILA
MFILDNSQSIDPGTFNTAVRQFVKDISLKYAFQNEIAEPSSRIGIVQFASGASVSYPLIERTRQQFLDTVDGGITYDIQGITNISLGLEVALQELNDRGIPAHDNVLVILMTDGVSTLDIKLTKPAADRMQAYTKFFAGVGVQGVNGNDISANLTNLQILIGNTALAYPDITAAEDPTTGIWHETRVIYPCPVPACKGVVFIGEMTEVIAQERKGIFLNATKSIAAYLNANPGGTNADQLQFAIGTYGNITFRKPVFQSFTDFNTVLDQLINDVAANNQPNAGQTNTGSILEDLYILLTTAKLNNYLVLFMGETERILDITVTETNVQKVLSTPAQVFVLDMTNGLWDNDYLFKRLARDANKIHNYTSGQTAADVATYYNNPSNQFAQIWNGMTCTAPADPVCNAFFDMFLVVKQSARTTKSLKYIASTLNAKYTAVSNYAGFTKRGLVYYGTGSALSNDLTFDSNGIYNLIQSLPADPNAANNYNMGYLRASDQLKISARTYGQNIIVIISDQYPASTDPQCTAVSNGQTAWNKDQKTPVVYYIPTSGPQLNQQPCPAFRVFNYTITGDPIADNPKMASIITEICSTPLPPLVCPCAGPNGIRTPPRQNFLQRYFG